MVYQRLASIEFAYPKSLPRVPDTTGEAPLPFQLIPARAPFIDILARARKEGKLNFMMPKY